MGPMIAQLDREPRRDVVGKAPAPPQEPVHAGPAGGEWLARGPEDMRRTLSKQMRGAEIDYNEPYSEATAHPGCGAVRRDPARSVVTRAVGAKKPSLRPQLESAREAPSPRQLECL